MADSEEVELVSEDEIGEPRKRQESFSTRVTRHYKRLSLILRICMFVRCFAVCLRDTRCTLTIATTFSYSPVPQSYL